MKFGLLLPNYSPTASAELIIRSARLAEELGYDSVWTTDHVIVPKEQAVPYGNLIESLIALSIASTATSKIRLGTSIIVIPQREPILLAKQLAAIDSISSGRLILGAGVGWLEKEYQYLGVGEYFNQRGKIFEEYIQVMRSLWSGKSDFQGQFVSFNDALFSPQPPQGEKLPLWIAGNSANAINRAAKIADAWHPVGLKPGELAKGTTALRSASNGRHVMVTLRALVEFPEVGGVESQINEGALNSWHILRGNPENLITDLVDFQKAGLEYIVLWFFHANWNELENSLITFAEDVLPSFR